MFNSIKKIELSALFVSQRIVLSVFLAKIADTPVPRNFYTCGRQPVERDRERIKVEPQPNLGCTGCQADSPGWAS